MMYLDTSAAIPLFVPEPISEAVEAWLAQSGDKLVTSDWLVTEFASALSIKVRRTEINKRQADTAWNNFFAFTQTGLHVMRVDADVFQTAARLTRNSRSGLRAGDALHLAIARNHRAEAIYSLDKTMLKAGKTLGLPVSRGIRL